MQAMQYKNYTISTSRFFLLSHVTADIFQFYGPILSAYSIITLHMSLTIFMSAAPQQNK